MAVNQMTGIFFRQRCQRGDPVFSCDVIAVKLDNPFPPGQMNGTLQIPCNSPVAFVTVENNTPSFSLFFHHFFQAFKRTVLRKIVRNNYFPFSWIILF
jgi:hypothetical protein